MSFRIAVLTVRRMVVFCGVHQRYREGLVATSCTMRSFRDSHLGSRRPDMDLSFNGQCHNATSDLLALHPAFINTSLQQTTVQPEGMSESETVVSSGFW